MRKSEYTEKAAVTEPYFIMSSWMSSTPFCTHTEHTGAKPDKKKKKMTHDC